MIHYGFGNLKAHSRIQVASTAARMRNRELGRKLFQELDKEGQLHDLEEVAAAGFLEDYQKYANKNLEEEERKHYLPYHMRAYYRGLAHREPEKVDFKVVDQYDDFKTKFYVELGLLEGFLRDE